VKRLIKVEYFDDESPIKIYTIIFIDDSVEDELTETNKFLSNYYLSNKEEIDIFLTLLEIIQNRGARENYFRNERNSDCRYLFALIEEDQSGKPYKGNLRLFCLYYGENKLILGNGSIKTSDRFQDDENLNLIAKDLQLLNNEIKRRLDTGDIWWENSELKTKNNLIFEIDV